MWVNKLPQSSYPQGQLVHLRIQMPRKEDVEGPKCEVTWNLQPHVNQKLVEAKPQMPRKEDTQITSS